MEGSKQQIEIGHGKLEFFTYTLTVKDESQNVVWEGELNGRPFKGPDGVPALQPEEIPPDLLKILRQGGIYYTEWAPAWEAIEDGDNETPSQGN